MDPRHPEQAISRMRELMKQYDRIEKDMNAATTSAKLAQLEREGGLVIQEICLVAPRLHEAMMQVSRNRRRDINRGLVSEEYDQADFIEAEIAKHYEQESSDIEVVSEQAEVEIVEPKPRKKKSTKKKSTKKKADK